MPWNTFTLNIINIFKGSQRGEYKSFNISSKEVEGCGEGIESWTVREVIKKLRGMKIERESKGEILRLKFISFKSNLFITLFFITYLIYRSINKIKSFSKPTYEIKRWIDNYLKNWLWNKLIIYLHINYEVNN